jgi:hypothetical protein
VRRKEGYDFNTAISRLFPNKACADSSRMEITDVSEPSRVEIKLDFIKPFEGHDVAAFTLKPQGDTTTVTWSMDGKSPYVVKLMGVFVDMDHLIGKDFEAGLASIKALAERYRFHMDVRRARM